MIPNSSSKILCSIKQGEQNTQISDAEEQAKEWLCNKGYSVDHEIADEDVAFL